MNNYQFQQGSQRYPQQETSLFCPRCKSPNINTQIISHIETVKDRRGFFWWVFIAWWWLPIKWLYFTIPALIFKLFGGRRKTLTKHQKVCICQNCGYSWKIR